MHLILGLTVLALGVVRPLWRRVAGLPPWSEHLSAGQRRLVHWTERALLALLVVVPLSGIVLVATGDDAWLPLHVAAHVAFFVALAAHLLDQPAAGHPAPDALTAGRNAVRRAGLRPRAASPAAPSRPCRRRR